MNWSGLVNWVIANYAAVVAAVMVIVRLVESAIVASKVPAAGSPTLLTVIKEFFHLG